jgi:hypothetical protein
MHKAAGGLNKTDFEIREGKLANVNISGDFFCFPHTFIQQIEKRLEGVDLRDIKRVIAEAYGDSVNQMPGVTIEDWMTIFRK